MFAVIPFKPFPPIVKHHRELVDFDWMAAIGMLARSITKAYMDRVRVLTDLETNLTFPVPTLRYPTTESQLMLWSLEVAACYLESDDFVSDTVMFDADQLVYRDISRWFTRGHDLGILVRPAPPSVRAYPIINGVQFWAHRGKKRLGPFYRRALDIARALPPDVIKWGADTEALQILLAPTKPGVYNRFGLRIELISSRHISLPLSEGQIAELMQGRVPCVKAPVLDFRRFRKRHMRQMFDITLA